MHTRESLDRILVVRKAPQLRLACATHPNAPVEPIYKDGALRLLCDECGFEAAVVKVGMGPDDE